MEKRLKVFVEGLLYKDYLRFRNEVYEATGCTRTSLSQWFSGYCNPNKRTQELIDGVAVGMGFAPIFDGSDVGAGADAAVSVRGEADEAVRVGADEAVSVRGEADAADRSRLDV